MSYSDDPRSTRTRNYIMGGQILAGQTLKMCLLCHVELRQYNHFLNEKKIHVRTLSTWMCGRDPCAMLKSNDPIQTLEIYFNQPSW